MKESRYWYYAWIYKQKREGKKVCNYNLKIPKIDKVNYICVCMYACGMHVQDVQRKVCHRLTVSIRGQLEGVRFYLSTCVARIVHLACQQTTINTAKSHQPSNPLKEFRITINKYTFERLIFICCEMITKLLH